jgi:hypothetical protein
MLDVCAAEAKRIWSMQEEGSFLKVETLPICEIQYFGEWRAELYT